MAKEVEELRDVLRRISGKILATKNVCIAMNFQIWIVIMAGYYILIAPLKYIPVWLTLCYWSAGATIFACVSRSFWRRASLLISDEDSRSINVGIMISWIVAAILGWFVIPSMIEGEFLQRLAIGLLSFLSIAVAGMIATIYLGTRKVAVEMIPAALIPILLIPVVPLVKNPMNFAGMGVVFSYGTTVILYIYRAFKVADYVE